MRYHVSNTIIIDPLSCVSLHLECYLQGARIGFGTGFVVKKNQTNYLITNWHVVTGRNPNDGQPLARDGLTDPDVIAIWYHATQLGHWVRKDERLLHNTTRAPLWREHSRGREIDVVALPLTGHEDTKVYPLDLGLSDTDLIISPSEPVSIVGFPYGIAATGKFPIWKTGNVASDIGLDYDRKPVFLIDATTKPGMSGSPVFARRKGFRQTSTGWGIGGGDSIRFLGIYSGRILEGSDIGMVWKPKVVSDITS